MTEQTNLEQNNESAPENEQQTNQPSAGKVLSSARLALGIELGELSEQIKVPVAVLEAIENDQAPKNLPETFLRGYIRAYARKVNVQESLVLQQIETTKAYEGPSLEMQSFSRRNKRKALERRLTIATWILGLILVMALVIWWLQDSGSKVMAPVAGSQPNGTAGVVTPQIESAEQVQQLTAPATETVQEQEQIEQQVTTTKTPEAAQAPVEVNEPSTSQVKVAQQNESATKPQQVEPQVVENKASQPISLTPAEKALLADSGEADEEGFMKVEMKFEEVCYVEIRDVFGEQVAYGNKPAGYLMSLNAQGPLSVVLGHTQGVTIWVNGKEFDMSFLPSNRVARFELEAVDAPASSTAQ